MVDINGAFLCPNGAHRRGSVWQGHHGDFKANAPLLSIDEWAESVESGLELDMLASSLDEFFLMYSKITEASRLPSPVAHDRLQDLAFACQCETDDLPTQCLAAILTCGKEMSYEDPKHPERSWTIGPGRISAAPGILYLDADVLEDPPEDDRPLHFYRSYKYIMVDINGAFLCPNGAHRRGSVWQGHHGDFKANAPLLSIDEWAESVESGLELDMLASSLDEFFLILFDTVATEGKLARRRSRRRSTSDAVAKKFEPAARKPGRKETC